MAATFVLSGCEKKEPFDTQTEDDAPLILVPYETKTGHLSYTLANPDTPLLDSVTVTPSAYTTVNWYLDGKLVYTGVRIEMTFPAGTYAITIEAVTTVGKRTQRTGTLTVNPYATDPYAAAPSIGRHAVPGFNVTLDGQNLTQVKELVISNDVAGADVAKTIQVNPTDDASLTFTLPELADGHYFLRLKNAEGVLYGADALTVYNASIALDGFAEFIPGSEWVITGQNLANVASVKLGDQTVTAVTATATSVTFTAPEVEEGKYSLSMTNKDGSAVLFITEDGAVSDVKAAVSAETVLWTGPVPLNWDAALVNISAETMSSVPLGSTIYVYFEIPEAEYHNLRITTPWWGDDLVAQFDVTEETPNPFTFVYDSRCKGIVDMVGSWSIVGFGETINKITYK